MGAPRFFATLLDQCHSAYPSGKKKFAGASAVLDKVNPTWVQNIVENPALGLRLHPKVRRSQQNTVCWGCLLA